MASYSSSTQTTAATNGSKSSAARSSSISSPISSDGITGATARASSAASSIVADASKPRHARGGDLASEPVTTDAGKPVLDRNAPEPITPDIGNAILVPGDFRGVDIVVVDPDGEPLDDVEQLLVLSPFPSSTSINEHGVGQLPMLSTTYTEFRGLAPRGDNVGYMWYEGVENVVGPQDDEAVIVLDPTEIKGMYAGSGIDMGGPLR